MMVRRLLLGLMSLGIVLGATGCSMEKRKESAMEKVAKHDQQIAKSVMDQLKKDTLLSTYADTFQIISVRGDTTVYGVVNSELAREHAEDLAMQTSGVTGVTSRIRLTTETPPGQGQTQTASSTSPSL